MTEIEKIAYAKTFIDKLSSGINPLDDTRIPKSDIVNNTRISNCFSYVSTILQQVIDNGEASIVPAEKKERRARKKPYYISPEQAAQFEFSDKPITLAQIIDRIMEVGPQSGVKKLRTKKILYWLAMSELITVNHENTGMKHLPTPAGAEIGISLVKCVGEKGPYSYLLYNNDAQHFIIDNIEAIVAFDNSAFLESKNLGNSGRIWSKEDNKKVVSYFEDGLSVSEIATLVKRSEKAVRIRLRRNGIDPYKNTETDNVEKH